MGTWRLSRKAGNPCLIAYGFLLLLLTGLGFLQTADAHSPYARQIQHLAGPHDEPLVLERLYGDGIFSGDPVRVQLKNSHNFVLAYAETDSQTAVFCPSIKFCWAFPYHLFLVNPWRLDYKHLDYQANAQKQSGDVYEPHYGTKHVMGFVPASPWIKLFSPLIISCDKWMIVFGVAMATSLFSFMLSFYNAKKFKRTQKWQMLWHGIGGVLLGVFAVIGLLASFVMTFTLAEPAVYLLFYAGIGFGLGEGFFHWLRLRKTPEARQSEPIEQGDSL